MSVDSSIGVSKLGQPVVSSYEKILKSLPAAFYTCDAAGYITNYNESAVSLWGRTPVLGNDVWCGAWKLFLPDGMQVPQAAGPAAETLRTGKTVPPRELIIEQPGGQRFNVLFCPGPLYDSQGTLTGVVTIMIDITGQKAYKSNERRPTEASGTLIPTTRREQLYQSMITEIEDYAIILLSKEGIIQNWNRGAEKIKGYSEQDIIGKSFKVFYPPADVTNGVPDRLLKEASMAGKANHEGWRIRKDGTRFWGSISITALHDTEGNITGFTKVTRDLTERRNHEIRINQINADLKLKNELLRRSEERYHRMVTEVEDYVIILLSTDGIIENWNRGAQKIKGYLAGEIVGKHFSIFYSEEDRRNKVPENLLREAIAKGKALHEGWRVRKDGTRFWGSVVITALHNDNGTVIGFTKVTRDLSEKKRAEEKLLSSSIALEQKNRELERINQELSSFAYISSHDLQEPLRKIQTFSDRIVETELDNLSEKGKDYFRRMQAGAARMQNLIRDILTYSRTTITERILEVKDLNEVLAHSISELEVLITEKNASIESARLPTLKVIPFQIQQLFNNLLTNSLKFSRRDVQPRIQIKSELLSGNALQNLHPLPDIEYCHISFSDNGIGFEPEYSKKIFEVFQRLHARSEYAGTGIGLAICKKIVENHNGFIFAEGAPDKGATFHIYLPVIE